MCGIAGLISHDAGFLAATESIRQMCAQIAHRGPDEEGIWVDRHIGIGMRRLRIIDLSTGSQPIFNEDRSILTVFNGEIYNFRELRADLEAAGHRFRTHSDTEVIVHLYEESGGAMMNKLRGMFALAVYDIKQDKLLLARDRLGKKPLHYALHGGVFYFGSEIKSLLAVAPKLAGLDNAALMQYFRYGYVPDPATAFSDIRKLPPGYCLTFDKGVVQTQQYWDLPEFATSDQSDGEAMEEMEAILSDSVRMRLIADVPLGTLLSGGVDSSIVLAVMSRISTTRPKTFTIGFHAADFDESKSARAVANKFDAEHHEILAEPDLWDTLEGITTILDEPFGDSSAIPTFCVSRIARKYVTVALTGDGGDELFGGYDRYIVHRRRAMYLDRLPAWAGRLYHRLIYPILPYPIRSRKLAYNLAMNARDRFVHGMSVISPSDGDRSLLSTDFLQSVAPDRSEEILQRHFDDAPALDLVSRMQYADIKTYMTADVLSKVDRMSMANSLEVRSPLLDHVFVEFAARLPLRMKIRNGQRKYLLRKLAGKLGVPREVLQKPKSGFALPLVHWMRSELHEEITSLLLEPRTLQRGYFRRNAIQRVLQEHQQGSRDHSQVIWLLMVFELWHRNFLEFRFRRQSEIACTSRGANSRQS